MASEHGKWETVVNKKKGQVSRSDVKKAKEKFYENPSHVKADFKNPLEEGETIYSAAFDKENKKPEEKYPSFHTTEASKKGNVSPGKSIQKQKKNPKPPKPSPLAGIQEKIEKLNAENISAIIKGVQERFPTHSLVWLKEVASWLQKELSGPAEKDLMFSSQPKGFPETMLTSNIRDQLRKLMKKSSDQSIEMLFCFCITMMLDDIKQGKSTIGLRILIQLVIDRLPSVLIAKMDEVLNGKAISQESFLIVIWVYSQRNNDLLTGIKIWWKVMYPVLRVGTHALHVVSYIEELLNYHTGTKFSSPVIDGRQFVDILNIVFAPKSPLTNSQSLKQRFESLYPIFKRLYFGDKPEQVVVEKFKFLLQINVVNDPVLQLELLHLLTFCLSKDPSCFASWFKNLDKTLKQSSILWGYFYDNFDDVHKELLSFKKYKDRNVIQHKAEEFFAQLQEIKRKGNGSKVGFAECFQVCERFQRKQPVLAERRLTMFSLLKYLTIGLLAFSMIDIYRANGFKGSSTESAATKLGVDSHARAAFVQLESVLGATGRWSKENLHPYYARVHAYLEPTMETGWNHTVKISNSIYEFSKPGLEVISKTTEKIFVKIDEILPGYVAKVTENTKYLWNSIFPTVHYYVNNAVTFLSDKTPILITNVSNSLNAATQWVYQLHPAFFDSSVTHATCAMNCLRRYANDLWDLLAVYTPIVMDTCVKNVKLVIEVLQGYFTTGQIWMQNMLRAANGGANSAASK